MTRVKVAPQVSQLLAQETATEPNPVLARLWREVQRERETPPQALQTAERDARARPPIKRVRFNFD